MTSATACTTRFAILAGSVLSLLATSAPAQDRPSRELYPRPDVTYIHYGEADLDEPFVAASPGTIGQRAVAGGTSVPVYIGDASRVFVGAQAGWDRLDFGGTPDDRLDLYTIGVPLRLMRDFGAPWSGVAWITPSYAGDLEGDFGRSLRGSALLLARRAFEWNGAVSAGAVVLRELDRGQVYPAIALDWQPTDDFGLSVSFPRSWVAYAPVQRLILFADVMPSGGSWRVAEAPGAEARGVDLDLKGYRCGGGAACDLGGGWQVQLSGGWVFARKYEADPDEGPDFTSDMDDTWFVRAGIGR